VSHKGRQKQGHGTAYEASDIEVKSRYWILREDDQGEDVCVVAPACVCVCVCVCVAPV